MTAYKHIVVPPGDRITVDDSGRLEVPDTPVIPFIEGDGTGPDIWRASRAVFDAAVEKAYGGRRRIAWCEVFAGAKAFNRFGEWLLDETTEAFKDFVVGIKGPLTTPVGGGIRSLNVALRQLLDLYVCLRPVRYFPGVPSPVSQWPGRSRSFQVAGASPPDPNQALSHTKAKASNDPTRKSFPSHRSGSG